MQKVKSYKKIKKILHCENCSDKQRIELTAN